MSSYNGVGYPGSIDTVGNAGEGEYPIQNYLLTALPGSSDLGLQQSLQEEVQRITGNTNPSAQLTQIGNFLKGAGQPSTLESLIVNFRAYLYTQKSPAVIPTLSGDLNNQINQAKNWLAANAPEELNYQSTSLILPGTTYSIYTSLLNNYIDYSGIATSNWSVYASDNQTIKQFNQLTDAEKTAYTQKFLDSTYADYVSKLTFQVTSTTTPAQLAAQFATSFANYNTTIITASSNATLQSLQTFYTAFFGAAGASGSDFNTFFAKFIEKYFGNPSAANPVKGSVGSFSPTQLFDQWTTEVITNFTAANPSAWTSAPSSVDAGGSKTNILNKIFSLLVLMVTALQRVAGAQTDRLTLLTKWQAAYTNLQNQVKFAISEDSSFNTNFAKNDNLRNEYNSYNSTLTETIKARKDNIADDAKNMQTQINQSNDAVNQQTSQATSILQELTTIFSSIYR